MIPLPETFFKDGFIFTQYKRDKKKALYRQRWKDSKDDRCDGFEVILIGETDKTYEVGKGWVDCPKREKYPSSEQWGLRGFSYPALERALAKYYELD